VGAEYGRGGRVHSRFEVRRGAAAFVAECGLPLRARPALRNDDQRWELLFSRVAGPLVQDLDDPAAALALLARGYQTNTTLSFMSTCRAFFSYCASADRGPLPASPAAIVGYVPNKHQRGTMAAPSLGKVPVCLIVPAHPCRPRRSAQGPAGAAGVL